MPQSSVPSPRRRPPARLGALLPVLPLLLGVSHGAWAQAGQTCETVAADVQAEQPTGLPTVSGQGQYSLNGRTSEQIVQQWATIQDPDPQACRLLRDVERRLAGEDAFARQQCPDVLPALRTQVGLARGEAEVLCKGRGE